MSDTTHKFLFLVVVGLSILFSRSYYLGNRTSAYQGSSAVQTSRATTLSSSQNPQEVSRETRSGEEASYESEASLRNLVFGNDSSVSLLFPVLAAEPNYRNTSFYRVSSALPDNIEAQSVFVGDLVSGEEYYSFNENKRWPLASLTKLMTAVVVMQNLQLQEIGHPLPSGEQYTVRDLLRMMLIASNNDAAEALAKTAGRESFLSAMDKQAEAWGMHATSFLDPSGLSASNQSTAHDLGILVRQIYANYPEVFRTTRNARTSVTEVNSGKNVSVLSTNEFAGRNDFLGGKTGYTDEAAGNLVSLFLHEGHPVVIIVLGTNDRFGETTRLLAWFESSFRSNSH